MIWKTEPSQIRIVQRLNFRELKEIMNMPDIMAAQILKFIMKSIRKRLMMHGMSG